MGSHVRQTIQRAFKRLPALVIAITGLISFFPTALASDFVVYSIYQSVDLGDPKIPAQKDFFVNMGTRQGLREGATLEVSRRVSTYDVMAEKLYQDVTFPIARLRVIHVEASAAIARLEKMLPLDRTPALNPRAVIVGDLVKIAP